MKISTRIISGYAILIAAMVGVLTHQVLVIHRMQAILQELSAISFRAGLSSLDLLRYIDLIDEYARKTIARGGDPDYRRQLREFGTEFSTALREARAAVRTDREAVEADRLVRFWEELSGIIDRNIETLGESRELSSDLESRMETLKAQAHTFHQAILQTIESRVSASQRAGQRAELLSWGMGAAAVFLSILVSFLLARSITEPLRHLTQGTRAIAEGKFFYRLDTSRNDEFSQVAHDFNTMTHRLGELDELKRDFVSHVSHELKAPLASIQEGARLMLEKISGPLTEKQERLLRLNLDAGARLSAMIGNLLDLSRMEAGVMEYDLRRQDLLPLVRTAAAELDARLREKRLSLESKLPENPIEVVCDGARIIQVLGNLTGNALRFSPEGALIRLEVETSQDVLPQVRPSRRQELLQSGAEGFVVVRVIDSGPGIPAEHKDRVFEKFHQVQQGRKMLGQGTGLGLAICRTIVEAHRGAIWVEDNPSGGTIVSFILPRGGDTEARRESVPI